MEENIDWQLTRHEIKDRGKFLFESGKWSDCSFLIGNESNQQILPGHKLILAMASPVFEAMFYGGLAEKNEPIPILDMQPEAFKAIIEYIYTDKININTVDKACDVCYGAKKYMLPYVVEQCTKFLWSDLSPKNACRAYEFAKLFEEPLLLEKCLNIMCTKTIEVLTDPSFEDVELQTLLEILDQQFLNIDSELDLFFGITRYFDKQTECSTPTRKRQAISQSPSTSSIASTSTGAVTPNSESGDKDTTTPREPSYRDAVKKIRFLTLSPQQFAEGPGRSTLLTQDEAFAILMNVSSPTGGFPMPEGFTINRVKRSEKYGFPQDPVHRNDLQSQSPVIIEMPPQHSIPMDDILETRKYYCVRTIRQQTECLNTSALDCSVTFNVDRSICITGVQVPTQIFCDTNHNFSGIISDRYSEIIYAHLLDSQGSRLTYTHCTPRVRFDSLMEISFDRPVFIRSHRIYKIGVVFNKVGRYPMCTCAPTVTCDNVFFNFGVGSLNESVRDGLIRAIVFTYSRDGA